MSRLVLLLAAILCSGCAAFLPPKLPPPAKTDDGETRLNIGYVRREATLEVEGIYAEGRVLASRIELEEPDDEVTLKGELTSFSDEAGMVNGVPFRVVEKSVVRGAAATGACRFRARPSAHRPGP